MAEVKVAKKNKAPANAKFSAKTKTSKKSSKSVSGAKAKAPAVGAKKKKPVLKQPVKLSKEDQKVLIQTIVNTMWADNFDPEDDENVYIGFSSDPKKAKTQLKNSAIKAVAQFCVLEKDRASP